MSKKHFNFKSSIRDWYIRAFPSDQLGYRINPLATFAGAVKCMADGGDIYKYLGVGDSPVRENVFFKIAAITGVDYDAVYDLWLHHDEDECSRLVFLGDHPDCAVDRDWRMPSRGRQRHSFGPARPSPGPPHTWPPRGAWRRTDPCTSRHLPYSLASGSPVPAARRSPGAPPGAMSGSSRYPPGRPGTS